MNLPDETHRRQADDCEDDVVNGAGMYIVAIVPHGPVNTPTRMIELAQE